MKTLTGIDIVDVAEFSEAVKHGGENFLQRVFLPAEITNNKPEHLAGLFAAKEAVTKALSLGPGKWLEIEISHEPSGRPRVKINVPTKSHDLSISHTRTHAVAVFVAIL